MNIWAKCMGMAAVAFIAAAAEPGAQGEAATTALIQAVQRGDLPSCEALLHQGADINEVCEGMTALKQAAMLGKADMCRYLLAAGADVQAAPLYELLSALHDAAAAGDVESCRVLLAAGAYVNAGTRTEQTPLHLAARQGHVAVCRQLIAAGADVNATDRWDDSPLLAILQSGEGSEESTAAIVEMLLSAGADKNEIKGMDDGAITPLSLAEQRGYTRILDKMDNIPTAITLTPDAPPLEQIIDSPPGVLVLYRPNGEKMIWSDTATIQRYSPCSTFKIAVAIIALECGVISPGDSTRSWSGKKYWNAAWNKDQDLKSAMHSSCVWYFRKLVDEIGQERMQAALQKLGYGNADISDWAGKLSPDGANAVNSGEETELRGFWLNSSLMISPPEQVAALERIFGPNSTFSAANLAALKEATLVHEDAAAGIRIYGKTGTSDTPEQAMHGWFTGFAETPAGPLYFCLYLGRGLGGGADDTPISGPIAKELALPLILRYCAENPAQ